MPILRLQSDAATVGHLYPGGLAAVEKLTPEQSDMSVTVSSASDVSVKMVTTPA